MVSPGTPAPLHMPLAHASYQLWTARALLHHKPVSSMKWTINDFVMIAGGKLPVRFVAHLSLGKGTLSVAWEEISHHLHVNFEIKAHHFDALRCHVVIKGH